MRILNRKKIYRSSIILALCLIFSLSQSPAQTFSTGTASDPQVLVGRPPALDNRPGQNKQETLVDIKAVDAPALHTQGNQTGVGSEIRYGQGIIIDSSGVIVTNKHVIGDARHIDVLLADGHLYQANVLRVSQPDLCFIKIQVPYPLRAISLADSSEIQIGRNVIAITNAGFNLQRVKGGQIIKIFKEKNTDEMQLMEMNIPLNPGDSGGAVLNQEGSLVGVIMGKQISDPSKSFAIPSSLVQQEYFKFRNSILN
jgi:S1-C subfamily serine protease